MLAESATVTSNAAVKNGYVKQIVTIGAFFFIFGFITWVNGTLIPYLRIACELEEWQAYLVAFAFYISYTFMAIPSSKLLQYTGMVRGMRVGLVVMAAGCLLFVPAALARYYPLFLAGLFIVGGGTTLLQTAVNPYITLLGPSRSAARRISIMGICNKFAGVLAPLVMGAIILRNSDGLLRELSQLAPEAKTARLDELAREVILPYCILTGILLLLAYLLKYAHLPEIKPPPAAAEEAAPESARRTTPEDAGRLESVGQWHPGGRSAFIFGFLAIFCSVGVEAMAGDTIGNYGLYHGLSLDVAKSLTSYTLAAMMTGYLLGIWAIPRFISQEKAYFYSALAGCCFTAMILLADGMVSVACVALLGLANALLWPAIWPQALRGLEGKALNHASAILIMGIAGGAIMPLVYGWAGSYTDNQTAYLVLLPCYFFNLYYAWQGKRRLQPAQTSV